MESVGKPQETFFEKRSEYIDFLKALAIFFVVLGHAPLCHHEIKQFIYSFHMPVFFAVYGMTYCSARHEETGFLSVSFVKKKIRRLMLPAFVWALAYSIVNSAIYGTFHPKTILYILYGSQSSFRMAHSLSSIWFLPVMFLAVIFVEYLMERMSRISGNILRYNTMILLLICILLALSFMPPPMVNGYPWNINVVPMAVACILMGYLLERISSFWKNSLTWSFMIAILSMILTYVLCKCNLKYIPLHNADMASGTYGNYFLYMLNVLAGILMMMSLSYIVSQHIHSRIISFVGMNTLAIFLMHKPLIRGLCNMSIREGWDSWILSVVYSVIVVLFCALLAYGINIICPEIVGGNRHNKKL